MSTVPADENTVELSIPAVPEWLALARTTGAAVASRWQFTYDEIADLRLAIDELCLTLIGPGGAERLDLAYSLDGSAIVVRGTVQPAAEVGTADTANGSPATAPGFTEASELSERILDALVDDHGSEANGSGHSAWLRKERSVAVT